MAVYSVYILSKSGGLIYNYDYNPPETENEKVFSFPLDIKLTCENKRIVVSFGQRDGIKVGHTLLSVNGIPVTGRQLEDGRDALELLENSDSYPLNLRFGRSHMSTNEKIFLASMFYPLYAIASQLSPEPHSSGISVLEADTFHLYCLQTLTGTKIIAVADPKQAGVEALLRRIYELYSDFALKNPFYALEMPVRCELFETKLQASLEQVEKGGTSAV